MIVDSSWLILSSLLLIVVFWSFVCLFILLTVDIVDDENLVPASLLLSIPFASFSQFGHD